MKPFRRKTMSASKKRATIYFDPDIHRVLKIKAAETSRSISDIIDHAMRRELAEDEEDLRAFSERAGEKSVAFEQVLKDGMQKWSVAGDIQFSINIYLNSNTLLVKLHMHTAKNFIDYLHNIYFFVLVEMWIFLKPVYY